MVTTNKDFKSDSSFEEKNDQIRINFDFQKSVGSYKGNKFCLHHISKLLRNLKILQKTNFKGFDLLKFQTKCCSLNYDCTNVSMPGSSSWFFDISLEGCFQVCGIAHIKCENKFCK